MAPDPTPDPGGPDLLPLVVDIDIDGAAWDDVNTNLADLCRDFAVATFSHVHKFRIAAHPGFREAELAMRLTTDEELQSLNLQFRGLAKPTNVLSFAALDGDGPALLDGAPLFLGDIAIAAETVIREAHEQQKPVRDHLAHMVVHGTLHLLGYDHVADSEAEEMEGFERQILMAAGLNDPYLDQDTAS